MRSSLIYITVDGYVRGTKADGDAVYVGAEAAVQAARLLEHCLRASGRQHHRIRHQQVLQVQALSRSYRPIGYRISVNEGITRNNLADVCASSGYSQAPCVRTPVTQQLDQEPRLSA